MPGTPPKTSNPFRARPLTRAERFRALAFARLVLAARPSPRTQENLRALARKPGWTPFPAPAGFGALHLLFASRCQAAGQHITDFYQPAPDWRPLDDAQRHRLKLAWALRRRALLDFAELATNSGVRRLILFKGESLAPFLDEPGLRFMGDSDVLMDPGDHERLTRALSTSADFAPAPTEAVGCWVHPATGAVFDLHLPANRFAEAVIDRAQHHPAFHANPLLYWPQPQDHLVLLALHCVQHGGARVWRDLLDMRVLLEATDGIHTAADALEIARASDCAAPVLALFRLVNRTTTLPQPLPESAHGVAENDVLAIGHLLAAGAWDTVPPMAVKAIRRQVLSINGAPWRLLTSLWRGARHSRETRHSSYPWVEREFGPRTRSAGFTPRVSEKAGLFLSLLCSGRARHVLRQMRVQKKIENRYGRPFSSRLVE